MGLIRKSLAVSFKEKSIFRFDYLVGTVFAFFYIVLKVYLWKGLYGAEGKEIGGIALNSMITYAIIAGFTEGVTKTSVMKELNDSVVDGTISENLLLPMGVKKISVYPLADTGDFSYDIRDPAVSCGGHAPVWVSYEHRAGQYGFVCMLGEHGHCYQFPVSVLIWFHRDMAAQFFFSRQYQQRSPKPVFRRVCADLVFPRGTKGVVGISALPLYCL